MSGKVNVKEYRVKLAKQEKDNVKKYYLMRFRPPHQVNLSDLTSPTLDRQHEPEKVDETPASGEGSEYGKKRREEARKRKYGVISKKVSPDDQPWELKEQKKGGKHFIGRKEGGVNSNSSYYVLTHCQDGTFEALPISGWYDFIPTIKYNYLDAEEAEKKFEQRHKTLNYFSVMLSKKVQNKDDDESKSESMLNISDIARGHGTVAAASDSDSNDEGYKGKKRGQSSRRPSKAKKKAARNKGDDDNDDDDDRTTDEGEMESREVDYISNDSSGPSSDEQRNDKEAEPKQQQKKQVGESLISDSSSESSEEELDDSGKAILALMKKQEDTNNSSGSDEAEEIDAMDQSQFLPLKSVKDENANSVSSSAKSSSKREVSSDAAGGHNDEPAAKKLKLSTSTTTITVDEVKYYLMRKPITATDLAKKFRSKKKDMDKMKVIERLGEIIQKNLNVERKTVQGKTYLSIKSS